MTNLTLGRIRDVYIALHEDTECAPTQFSYSPEEEDDILCRPSLYPLCNIPSHHPDSSSTHIHDVSASETFVRSVLHDHGNSAHVPSSSSLAHSDLPLFIVAPIPVAESPTTTLPLDDNFSLPVQTSPENCRIPSTSTNSPSTSRIRTIHRRINVPPKTMQMPTPEPSPSIPLPKSKASTSPESPPESPQGTVAVEHTTASHTTSGDINVPSLASPAPIPIDATTGLLLPSDSA